MLLSRINRTSISRKSTILLRIVWGCCLVACFSEMRGWAADSTRYNVRAWQTDEGLPHNSIRAIAQTSEGYLWVGSEAGLAKFDGIRFTMFDELSAPELNSSTINALLVTTNGDLWIGMEGGGLARRANGIVSHWSKKDGLPGAHVRCLIEAKDGSVWVGTESGLAQMKAGALTVFNSKPGVTDVPVHAVCEDARGILRAATPNGMWSLDVEGRFSDENFGIGSIRYGLRTVYPDRAGNLWFGGSGGLRYVNLAEERPVVRSTKLLQQIISTVREDQSGQRWVGTVRGVVRMRGDEVIGWPLNDVATGDLVHAVFEDREGNIWLGCRDGLYRLTPSRFTNISVRQGLPANDAMSVCQDASGEICVANFVAGLSKVNAEGVVTVIRSTNGLSDDAVLSLHPARDGGLWVGMDYGRGLNKLDQRNRNTLSPLGNLIAAPIRVIHEARDGAVWIGTGKGLNVLRGEQLATYTITNGLAGDNITALCEDRNAHIWVGTVGGISRWSGKGFSNYTERQGLPNNLISSLHEDREGDMWVGTRGGGLSRLKAGRFNTYSTKDGLFSDDIFEVVGDDADYLWMSCRRGLFRVSRKQFDEFDAGKIPRISCTVFGREDGLATVQFNGVAKPAGFKSTDGRIWFPTIRGVVAVDPQVKANELPPHVQIEEVTSDRKSLATGQADYARHGVLEIPPGSGGVEIHYTALSLQAPEKNRFKYKLEGVDLDWVDAGDRRIAYYNNVLPGRYRFRVIACNNDGVWNESGAQLDMHIQPHYWQTNWFRAVIIALPIVLAAAFYRARVARLRALADLRIRIAQDLHDDIGSRLTRVAMVTELADRETPAGTGKSHIQNIARTVRDITRAMDEIVWTINPRNDSLENLANYIFHYAQEYFQDTGVRCRLDLPHDLPDRRVTTEERHNLFMAVKEALNNVLKHAGATEVRIALTQVEKRRVIVISDNGRGVSEGLADPTGAGMKNMRQRLETIGGEFELESTPSTGTTVMMRLPGRWSA